MAYNPRPKPQSAQREGAGTGRGDSSGVDGDFRPTGNVGLDTRRMREHFEPRTGNDGRPGTLRREGGAFAAGATETATKHRRAAA